MAKRKELPANLPTNTPPRASAGTRRVRVARSILHGQGVFAVSRIRPHTFIGEYIGELLLECPRDSRFVLRVTVDDATGHYHWIDARDPQKSNFTRFLNDPGPGQVPNCEFQ